jgi:hypothetical protein
MPRSFWESFMRVAATLFASLVALTPAASPAGAAVVPTSSVARAQSSVASVSIDTLRTTGARTDVTVRGLRRAAQARWVDHVVDERLVSLDGCLSDPSDSTVHRGVYRTRVNTLCAGGVAQARRAAQALTARKPWYSVTVRSVPVVAFTLTTDLDQGRGDPVEAALARLPKGDFLYIEGDDVSMVYVGQSVTQAQVDAARAAFAGQLRIAVDRVSVSPIDFG